MKGLEGTARAGWLEEPLGSWAGQQGSPAWALGPGKGTLGQWQGLSEHRLTPLLPPPATTLSTHAQLQGVTGVLLVEAAEVEGRLEEGLCHWT